MKTAHTFFRQVVEYMSWCVSSPVCLCCGEPLLRIVTPHVCEACFELFTPCEAPRCSCCYAAMIGHFDEELDREARVEDRCADCASVRPSYEQAFSPWVYEGPVVDLIARVKYGRDLYALDQFGALGLDVLTEKLEAWGEELGECWLVPVPMHPRAVRRRGFSQTVILADRLSRSAAGRHHRLVPGALAKVRDTRQQAGLGRRERSSNLEGVFRADPDVSGRAIILLDDVMTTGATAETCARTLRSAGASSVRVLAWARR